MVGQGLLVYAIGVPPLLVGLTLLTQPAISALLGWLAYGETLSPLDWAGAVAIARGAGAGSLAQRGLRGSAQPVEAMDSRQPRSSTSAASLPSPSAKMRCSTAGGARRSTSAAGQLGHRPAQARLALPKDAAGLIDAYIQAVDRALAAAFPARARSRR